MAIVKKYGSVKRFGARYGRTVKEKLGKIEHEHRKRQKCPYCRAEKVKRTSSGIWHCQRCLATFASRAYTIARKVRITEAPAEDTLTESVDGKKKEAEDESEEIDEQGN